MGVTQPVLFRQLPDMQNGSRFWPFSLFPPYHLARMHTCTAALEGNRCSLHVWPIDLARRNGASTAREIEALAQPVGSQNVPAAHLPHSVIMIIFHALSSFLDAALVWNVSNARFGYHKSSKGLSFEHIIYPKLSHLPRLTSYISQLLHCTFGAIYITMRPPQFSAAQ